MTTAGQLIHFGCGGVWVCWQDEEHVDHATCDRCHHDQAPVVWPAVSATIITPPTEEV